MARPEEPKAPPAMTADRFAAILDAYGGAGERWPAAERAAALAFAASDPEAEARRQEALALDAMLARLPEPAPSPGLAARILDQAPSPAAPRPARSGSLGGFLRALWPTASLWQPAGVFAAAAACGIALGLTLAPTLLDGTDPLAGEDLIALAFPTLDGEVDWP